jgi:hypothetical protein
MADLSGVDLQVLNAFREVSKGDQADVAFHEIVVRGETAQAVASSLTRLMGLKYINSIRFYGPGPKLREMIAAEQVAEQAYVAEVEAAQQTQAAGAGA